MMGMSSEILSNVSEAGGETVVVMGGVFGSSFTMLLFLPGDFGLSSIWL